MQSWRRPLLVTRAFFLLKVGAFSMIVKLQTSRMLVSSSSGVGRRLRTGAGIGEPESNLVDKKIRAVVDWWTAPQ